MVEIKNIIMIGAGLMGHNAAQICLMAGYNVTLVDINDDFVNAGAAKIDEDLKKLEAKGKLGEGISATSLMGNLKKARYEISFDPNVTDSLWIESSLKRMRGVHKVEEI